MQQMESLNKPSATQLDPELRKLIQDNFLKFLKLKTWPEEKQKEALHKYILKNFKVNIPRYSVCPNHDAPFDFVYAAFMSQYKTIIAMANRSGGKTLSLAILGILESLANDNCESANLGAIQAQAMRCAGYIKRFVNGNPDFLARLKGDMTATKIPWFNGSLNEILVATMTGVNCLSGNTLVDCPRDLKKYPKGIPIKELVGKEFDTYGYDIA